MTALGFSWANVTATQVYTIFDIQPLVADEFVRRGAMSGGLAWHFARRRCRASISRLMYAARPRIGDLTHTPIEKIPSQCKRILTLVPRPKPLVIIPFTQFDGVSLRSFTASTGWRPVQQP